jgi:hypothetical protein
VRRAFCALLLLLHVENDMMDRRPSSLDAAVFGHLGCQLFVDLPNNTLRATLEQVLEASRVISANMNLTLPGSFRIWCSFCTRSATCTLADS